MKKMLKYWLILFVIIFFPGIASAQTFVLENFSQNRFLEEIQDEIILSINESEFILSKKEVEPWIKEETDLKYNLKYISEIENTNFCQYKKSIVCSLSFSQKNEPHIQKTSDIKFDTNLIGEFIEDLARKSNKDPENAKLKIDSGKVSAFSLSAPGIELDKERSVEVLKDYLTGKNRKEQIKLPFKETKPEISIASIDNLGITDLIGEGVSDFRGSPKNRVYNIKVATGRFDGLLIKPGEEFSFVKNLGEVDKEHGYLPELVIKNNKTEPEFGGGICQVSTTTFRAAINSGLEITARRNHAYPVSYYNPQGMDATVYVPRPDLRFINDTPGYILIQTKIEGTRLTFQFYGTDDGRKIEIIGPRILERNPDGSMKATFTQKINDKDGQLAREDIFNSSYDSPDNYPHPPGPDDVLTEKPKSWSDKEWKKYKKEHGI